MNKITINMKKIICIIFSLYVLSPISADEIPYELLTSRMIEKLQSFGLRAIDYYSMVLYGSNNTESLTKTMQKIQSFPKNKEACGKFIYYWWHMWYPMSERYFIENAYMTPAEAYYCCKIGDAIYKEEQMYKAKQEQEAREKEEEEKRNAEINLYTKWVEEGKPDSITPNWPAILKINAGDDFAQYIYNNRSENPYKKSISVKIEADGKLSCLSSDESDKIILELLNIEVKRSACYVFENTTRKSIPMETIETIEIIEEREKHPVRAGTNGQYEAFVKLNKKTSTWDVQIKKDYLVSWAEDTKSSTQEYNNAIVNTLNNLPYKPKRYIKFHLLDSYIDIHCSSYCYGTGHITLPPIVIIDSPQSHDE